MKQFFKQLLCNILGHNIQRWTKDNYRHSQCVRCKGEHMVVWINPSFNDDTLL